MLAIVEFKLRAVSTDSGIQGVSSRISRRCKRNDPNSPESRTRVLKSDREFASGNRGTLPSNRDERVLARFDFSATCEDRSKLFHRGRPGLEGPSRRLIFLRIPLAYIFKIALDVSSSIGRWVSNELRNEFLFTPKNERDTRTKKVECDPESSRERKTLEKNSNVLVSKILSRPLVRVLLTKFSFHRLRDESSRSTVYPALVFVRRYIFLRKRFSSPVEESFSSRATRRAGSIDSTRTRKRVQRSGAAALIPKTSFIRAEV